MALTVFHRCLDHTGLSRQLHAVSRWTQLRHLRIRWVSLSARGTQYGA